MAPNNDNRPTDEQITAWKAQYGADAIYEVGFEQELVIICHRPTRQNLSRFVQISAKDPAKAMETLIDDCLLFPEREVVRAAFEERPGLILGIGNQLAAVSGLGEGFFNRRL